MAALASRSNQKIIMVMTPTCGALEGQSAAYLRFEVDPEKPKPRRSKSEIEREKSSLQLKELRRIEKPSARKDEHPLPKRPKK